MAKGRFDKYFFKEPIVQGKFGPRLIFFSRNYVGEKNFSILWNCITEPFEMVKDPHAHDFDQFLHFYGANSLNIKDFDAEVEIYLGEEGEKRRSGAGGSANESGQDSGRDQQVAQDVVARVANLDLGEVGALGVGLHVRSCEPR